MHTTAEGHLYTWGCSRDGRLGHDGVTAHVKNGDVVKDVALPIRYPMLVQQLKERIVSSVSCSANATFALAGTTLAVDDRATCHVVRTPRCAARLPSACPSLRGELWNSDASHVNAGPQAVPWRASFRSTDH